jgi:GNAT superfamily N-acetyltransferase
MGYPRNICLLPASPGDTIFVESNLGQRGMSMGLTYFKRFRMEYDLTNDVYFDCPPLPAGYQLLPFRDALIEAHAATKYRSFRQEIDANVFPCLGDRDGCLRLMNEIVRRDGFLREATWLLQFRDRQSGRAEFCGTIQGVCDHGHGSIQNIGITPAHRGRMLGTVLMSYSLEGFRRAGLRRATLEVTAQNYGAIRLYERLGFKKTKIVYKSAEVAYA